MSELELLRNELDHKITAVTVENVKMSQAIGSYGERFTAVDARFDAIEARMDATDMRLDFLSQDMDRRFTEVDRRFEAIDRRLDSVDRRLEKIDDKLDSRFGWQTFLMFVLGALVLFGDTIRPLMGL